MMIARKDLEFLQFVTILNTLETGHHTHHFNGRRYGVTMIGIVYPLTVKLENRAFALTVLMWTLYYAATWTRRFYD